jgi:hypothetical protein
MWVIYVLKPDALNLVLCEPLLCTVIKLGRAWALVRRHFLRVFERAAIGDMGLRLLLLPALCTAAMINAAMAQGLQVLIPSLPMM